MKYILIFIFFISCNNTDAYKLNKKDLFNEWVKGCYQGGSTLIKLQTRNSISSEQQRYLIQFCVDIKIQLDASANLK